MHRAASRRLVQPAMRSKHHADEEYYLVRVRRDKPQLVPSTELIGASTGTTVQTDVHREATHLGLRLLDWLAAHPDVTVSYFDQCAVSMFGEVLSKKPTVVFGMGLRPFDIRCGNACSSRLPGTDLHRLVIAPRDPDWKRRGQQRVSSEAAAVVPLGAIITLLYVARLKPRALAPSDVCVAAISGFPAHTELEYDSALLHASSGHTSGKVLHRTLADVVVPFPIRTNGGAVKLSSEVPLAA
jgi:hypothetical protein